MFCESSLNKCSTCLAWHDNQVVLKFHFEFVYMGTHPDKTHYFSSRIFFMFICNIIASGSFTKPKPIKTHRQSYVMLDSPGTMSTLIKPIGNLCLTHL